jgi:hypothetical protein
LTTHPPFPHPSSSSRQSKRYLGLELSGAKNQKTSLAAIEFYPKEKKIFLLDIFDKIATHEDQTSDEALLDVIREVGGGVSQLGVNVPLELPPCITCVRKTCPLPTRCTVPAVKWMKDYCRKVSRSNEDLPFRVKEFTPYTQRPIELWVKYGVLSQLSEDCHFEVDETLGGNKAPLTARMQFIKRHLRGFPLLEVWPKLSIAVLGEKMGIHKRIISSYRRLEDGIHSRESILTKLSERNEIFIYDRDMRKLSQNLTAFDAFICAFTALLSDLNQCAKMPKGFPKASGWVHYPQV